MNEKTKAIIRLLVALVPVLNIILVAIGKNPLPYTQEEISVGISAVIGVAGTLYAWWKNNNISVEAQTAQKVLNEMKDGRNKAGGEGDPLEVE